MIKYQSKNQEEEGEKNWNLKRVVYVPSTILQKLTEPLLKFEAFGT